MLHGVAWFLLGKVVLLCCYLLRDPLYGAPAQGSVYTIGRIHPWLKWSQWWAEGDRKWELWGVVWAH